MPKIYDADTYKDVSEEQLRDAKWFAEKLGDLIWSPGGTQETFEENVRILRTVYQERQMDAVFMELFARVRKALDGGRAESVADAGITVRMIYTADDFLYTDYPYEEIFSETNGFRQEQIKAQLEKQAKSVGIRNFRTLYGQYERSQKNMGNKGRRFCIPNMLGGTLELDPGDWKMDGTGIYKDTVRGREYACTHSIAPVRRLRNIDTGDEKLTLAYERSGSVRYITKPKRELFDGAKVLDLSSVGVAVTSQTAKVLARYLCEIEDINYDVIPQQDSVARMGYLADGRFSPYVDDIAFDGDTAYGAIFGSIRAQGDFEVWKRCAVRCRQESVTAQIMLAGAFASVMIKRIGGLPFFVHLWGVDSGTGKTVALMLAASVWGNPELGQYPQTFNSTQVGHEKTAAFLGNIPMCIDELQLSKDSHGHSKFDVYQLAQGVGRTRGNKAGGIDRTPTWSLCILTTGESPIVQSNAGAGAVNRVIDIECKADQAAVQDGAGVCKVIRTHFGHAGRRFVEQMTEAEWQEAQAAYDAYYRDLSAGETTEKQAMAAALLLTADRMADKLIYHTGRYLTVSEISEFLKSKSSVSAGERGYSYLCDWVGLNSAKFAGEGSGDCYGLIDGDFAYINRTVFRSACKDGGFDERAMLSWLKAKNLIQTRGRNLTRGKRINGVNVECVVLRMPDYGIPHEEDELL